MSRYRTSSGEPVEKSIIDRKVREAKAAFVQIVEPYCMACGSTQGRLDCSHIISVDRCQKLGKSDLAYDIKNLQLECRECHGNWEGASIEIKSQQKNFNHKLSYIQKHDPQRYISLTHAAGI